MKLLLLLLLISSCSLRPKQSLELIADVHGSPWGLEFINKDLMITTRKDGFYLIVDVKSKNKKKFPFPLKLNADGQGGLLDVEKHPNFIDNKKIYFTYSKSINGKMATTLAMGIYRNNQVENIQDIYVTNSISKNPYHFGSRITFDDSGYLYFSIGDRGHRLLAQDLNVENGKILRLNDDGSIPKTNPFKSAIWSYGHRNPQGLKWHKKRKILISVEHGPRGGDEINIIKKGGNYGWPIVSQGKEYNREESVGIKFKKGMFEAIKYYIPSIAPCGLEIIGDKLYIGSLALTHLNIISLDDKLKVVKEEREFQDQKWRIRDIKQSPDGKIYISTDHGELYRIN